MAGSNFAFDICDHYFTLSHMFACFQPTFLFPEDYQEIFSAIVFWWGVLIYPPQHNGWVTIPHHHHHGSTFKAISMQFQFRFFNPSIQQQCIGGKVFKKISSSVSGDLSKLCLFSLRSNVLMSPVNGFQCRRGRMPFTIISPA